MIFVMSIRLNGINSLPLDVSFKEKIKRDEVVIPST